MSITILQLDVNATMVPSGHALILKAGTPIRITREKGGSVTAEVFGNLVLLGSEAYPALGKKAPEDSQLDTSLPISEQIISQLKRCYDPEIPVNVVDLGLIYRIEIEEREENRRVAFVDLTLTAPGCGMGPVIAEDVKGKILELPGIDDAEVEIVWDPPWTQELISEEGKMELGLI